MSLTTSSIQSFGASMAVRYRLKALRCRPTQTWGETGGAPSAVGVLQNVTTEVSSACAFFCLSALDSKLGSQVNCTSSSLRISL